MTVSSLGQGDPSTIMSGVIQLVQHGMIPIAAVVFIASILVPTFKLVGIALLLFSYSAASHCLHGSASGCTASSSSSVAGRCSISL
jgi:uncharacterized paraquat-inducible protein A